MRQISQPCSAEPTALSSRRAVLSCRPVWKPGEQRHELVSAIEILDSADCSSLVELANRKSDLRRVVHADVCWFADEPLVVRQSVLRSESWIAMSLLVEQASFRNVLLQPRSVAAAAREVVLFHQKRSTEVIWTDCLNALCVKDSESGAQHRSMRLCSRFTRQSVVGSRASSASRCVSDFVTGYDWRV